MYVYSCVCTLHDHISQRMLNTFISNSTIFVKQGHSTKGLLLYIHMYMENFMSGIYLPVVT